MFSKTSDGSFLDSNGKVLYFSTERFIRDICEGDCCFICGISRSEADFNNEHVFPRWILRKYDLFGQSITLPNKTKFEYNKYILPCCKQCNSLMGKKINRPKFFTKVNLHTGQHLMSSNFNNFVELYDFEPSEFGAILGFCCNEIISVCGNKNIEQMKDQVKQGKLTFLFDEEGNFITNSSIPIN